MNFSLPASLARPAPPPAGLLRILRQAIWLRVAMVAIGAVLYSWLWQYIPLWLMLFVLGESSLLLVLASVPPFARWLGTRPLAVPLVLGWMLITPILESVLGALTVDPATFLETPLSTVRPGDPLVWLVVPVVLVAWQYGRRGVRLALAVLLVEYAGLGLIVTSGLQSLGAFALNAGARLVTLALLGYVVTRLAEAQRAEHAALEQVNRELARRAATAEQLVESRERNRLARELHDTLAHSLSGLSVQLQALGTVMPSDAAAGALLHEAQATARSGIHEARRAIHALRATPLEDLGLAEALRQLCRGQSERTGVTITAEVASLAALDPLTEQAVYRVAEAALANVERHAAATRVSVRLEPVADGLRLEVRDDGVGFDPQAVADGHFGLAGMAERAALIGATLSIESAPGRGACVVLQTG